MAEKEEKPKKKRGNPKLQKGVQPDWLKGYDFKAHPERINKYGVPSDVVQLKRMIQAMGNEEVVVTTLTVGKGKNKKEVPIKMSRFERILLDWFDSQSFDKQQAIMQYGVGKVPDLLEVSDRKVIRVTIEKEKKEGEKKEEGTQERL
jgi:hypothetical protein